MKKKILITALTVMLFGSALPVYAAPQYMEDGAVFDAEWYLEQNPDIAAAFPANVSPEILYQHYLIFGIKEGRTPYNIATFNPDNVLPYTGPATIPIPIAPSNLTPASSSNQNAQNYGWYSDNNRADTVKSYLCENPDGGVTRVEYIDGKIIVEDYDNYLYLRSSRTIPMELSLWGGFFAGEKYNFFIFGKENPSQNNDTEVIRVVKYSKNWKRLGEVSLRGANTTIPFAMGSLRCTEYGDYLYIRTCHEMYPSRRDKEKRQANLTLAVRQSDMRLTDTYYIAMNNRTGCVSPSINQFVLTDQEQNIVTLDHSNDNPRNIILMRYNNTKAGEDKFSGSVSSSSLLTFPSDNNTGASVGGLAETANGYIAVLNYDTANIGMRDIYMSYTNKNGLDTTLIGVTALTGTFTPILAPISLNGGYLMWTDINGNFYYTQYADGGIIGAVNTATATLSDCQPICHNGEVLWYVTSNSAPVFYKIDAVGMLHRIPANGQ